MKTWFWFGFSIMLINAVLGAIATFAAINAKKTDAYELFNRVIELTLMLEFTILVWNIWGSTIVWDKAGIACSNQITTSSGNFMAWWIAAYFTWIGLWSFLIVCSIFFALLYF